MRILFSYTVSVGIFVVKIFRGLLRISFYKKIQG